MNNSIISYWLEDVERGLHIVAPSGFGKTSLVSRCTLDGLPMVDTDDFGSIDGDKWMVDWYALGALAPTVMIGTADNMPSSLIGYERIGLDITYEHFKRAMFLKARDLKNTSNFRQVWYEEFVLKSKFSFDRFRKYTSRWYRERGVKKLLKVPFNPLLPETGWFKHPDVDADASISILIVADVNDLTKAASYVNEIVRGSESTYEVILVLGPDGGSINHQLTWVSVMEMLGVPWYVCLPEGALSASYGIALSSSGIVCLGCESRLRAATHGPGWSGRVEEGPEDGRLYRSWQNKVTLPYLCGISALISTSCWVNGNVASLAVAKGRVNVSPAVRDSIQGAILCKPFIVSLIEKEGASENGAQK